MNDRRIFGWDLPPGVRSCDIPGSRPEEMEAEAYAEAHYDVVHRAISHGDSLEDFINDTRVIWPEVEKEVQEERAKEAAAEEAMYRQMDEDERRLEEASPPTFAGEEHDQQEGHTEKLPTRSGPTQDGQEPD